MFSTQLVYYEHYQSKLSTMDIGYGMVLYCKSLSIEYIMT